MKKQYKYDKDFKIEHFGHGDWVEEPDIIDFTYKGMDCCIVRTVLDEPMTKDKCYFGGLLCGYVKIPEGHPYFRHKGYDLDIDCHGGITFNEAHEEHWVGFDCGHSTDRVPTMEHLRNTRPELIEIRKQFPIPEEMKDHPWYNPVYRNMEFCIEECKTVITQLIDVAVTTSIKKGAEALKEFEGESQ